MGGGIMRRRWKLGRGHRPPRSRIRVRCTSRQWQAWAHCGCGGSVCPCQSWWWDRPPVFPLPSWSALVRCLHGGRDTSVELLSQHAPDGVQERLYLLLSVAVQIHIKRVSPNHLFHLLETSCLCQLPDERCLLTTWRSGYLIRRSMSSFLAAEGILALVICKVCLNLNRWSSSSLISFSERCFSYSSISSLRSRLCPRITAAWGRQEEVVASVRFRRVLP